MTRPLVMTPFTLTMMLAYIHYYTPNFLPGRCLPVTALRQLAARIGAQKVAQRSARSNRLLAMHLSLAEAAELVSVANGRWQTTATTIDWLEADITDQANRLQRILVQQAKWDDTLNRLSLVDVFPIDYRAFIEQTIGRWPVALPAAAQAAWLPADTDNVWRLHLPETLPPVPLFHLLQLGNWTPDEAWEASTYTIAVAAQRGYSLPFMKSIIETATGQPLSLAHQAQLAAWHRQHDAVQIKPVYLLTVKDPVRLSQLKAKRRMGSHIGQQLSPRHAIVSPRIIPSLQRLLAKEGLALDAPPTPDTDSDAAVANGMAWFGMRLLLGLAQWLPQPLPLPYTDLRRLEGQLDSAQLADLEQKATAFLDEIGSALRGRDGFFPPERPVDDGLLTAVREALDHNYQLAIAYQSLGELLPRYRTVQPLRLTENNGLHYLEAYCYLAEANRVFRLDRVSTYTLLPLPGSSNV